MTKMTRILSVAALLALTASAAFAGQSKTIPGEMVTVTAKVEAIEMQSRTVTLKKTDGTYTTLVVPTQYERFSSIKVGDTVTARYYDNIVVRKLNPGEKPVDSSAAGITPAPGTRPVGTAAAQRTITTTITAIDEAIPSITLTGPNGWVYSSKVQDKPLLKTLKVGDKVNVTWTEAVSIAVTPPK
jgi:Cu/Ag efflux protein CusF